MNNSAFAISIALGGALELLGQAPVVAPVVGAGDLVTNALTQYGPMGIFALALWFMVRGKDAEVQGLRGEIREMHAKATEMISQMVAAMERNTASNAKVSEELSEVSAKLDDLADRESRTVERAR